MQFFQLAATLPLSVKMQTRIQCWQCDCLSLHGCIGRLTARVQELLRSRSRFCRCYKLHPLGIKQNLESKAHKTADSRDFIADFLAFCTSWKSGCWQAFCWRGKISISGFVVWRKQVGFVATKLNEKTCKCEVSSGEWKVCVPTKPQALIQEDSLSSVNTMVILWSACSWQMA